MRFSDRRARHSTPRCSGQAAFNRSAVKEALAHVIAGLETVSELPDGPERIGMEEGLEAIRALALKMSVGLGHAETKAAFERAYEFGIKVDDSPYLFPVMFGMMQGDWASGLSDTSHPAGHIPKWPLREADARTFSWRVQGTPRHGLVI